MRIVSEKLWTQTVIGRVNKTNLLDFEGSEPVRVRNNSDYLPDDVSIMLAVNKQLQSKTIFVDFALCYGQKELVLLNSTELSVF